MEEEETHRPIEGQLLKWTNVVKGELPISKKKSFCLKS